MSSTLRTTLAAILAAALLPAFAAPAWAAVPSNDEPGGAIALVKGVPQEQDTTEATTSAIDAQLNLDCGAPFTEASVWFTYTPAQDEMFVVQADADYEAGILVVEGDPSSGKVVNCGPQAVAIVGAADVAYTLMVFDAGGTNGGPLTVTVFDPPPAPTVALTVDPRGTAFKDGSAFVSGGYSCTGGGTDTMIQGLLTQRVGRLKINAEFLVVDLTCDGESHSWSAYAYSSNGIFAGGKAATVAISLVCDAFTCGEGWAEGTVQLTRAKLK